MRTSKRLRASSRSLAAQTDGNPIRVKPVEVHVEVPRRRQRTGRGGVPNFVLAAALVPATA